jgi:hypothetical protein
VTRLWRRSTGKGLRFGQPPSRYVRPKRRRPTTSLGTGIRGGAATIHGCIRCAPRTTVWCCGCCPSAPTTWLTSALAPPTGLHVLLRELVRAICVGASYLRQDLAGRATVLHVRKRRSRWHRRRSRMAGTATGGGGGVAVAWASSGAARGSGVVVLADSEGDRAGGGGVAVPVEGKGAAAVSAGGVAVAVESS